jgi:NAD(P)-dependent dehydrogenase (short-subunit alcohol dehydrogenase family)
VPQIPLTRQCVLKMEDAMTERTERIVVVGGTSGIGLATARRLAAGGHDVAITGRNEDRLEAALADLPDHVGGRSRRGRDGPLTYLSAISAGLAAPGTSALAAANAAVEAWARTLAVELAPIRVNVVFPGVIDTPWWGDLPEDARRVMFDQYAGITPAGRIGTADDVAHSIQFLIESPFTTGVVLPCDGGVRLAGPRV